MRRRRIEFLVYLVGVFILGIFQSRVRATIGSDLLVFIAVVMYLLLLRGLGWLINNCRRHSRRKAVVQLCLELLLRLILTLSSAAYGGSH